MSWPTLSHCFHYWSNIRYYKHCKRYVGSLRCEQRLPQIVALPNLVWTKFVGRAFWSYHLEQFPVHSPHRISVAGRLLFMRCVSLTLTGLISAWRRGEESLPILANSLSDGVTVLCLGQWKSRHLKVCGIMKRTCYFKQMEYLTFLTGAFVIYDVGDTGSTCCCFGLLFLTAPTLIGEPPLPRKLKSAFANKNSSFIQTMISFIFLKIYAPEVIIPVLWIISERNL